MPASGEHTLSHIQVGDGRADGVDVAGCIAARRVRKFWQVRELALPLITHYLIIIRTEGIRYPLVSPDVGLDRVDSGIHDPDQNLVWCKDVDLVCLFQLKHLGAPELVHSDGLHFALLIEMQRSRRRDVAAVLGYLFGL